MSCFNTIHIPCPECGKCNCVVSKAGDCSMSDIGIHEASISLAELEDVEGERVCQHCHTKFNVVVQHMVSVIRYEYTH